LRSFRLASRLGTAAVLSALALSLVAAPTSAAGKIRVVDNDGKGSATNCDAGTKAFSKVQKAIDASAAGDTVRVCPGTYKERLSITGARNGLKVLSTKAQGAVIKDPSIYMPTMLPLVRITGVDNVVFKGFKIRALSWTSYLSQTMDGIWADDAKNVTIQGNDLGWVGPADDRSNLTHGIVAKNGTTGLIKGNTVKDPFNSDGVLAMDAGTSVTISGNTINAVFAGNPSINGEFGIAIKTGAKGIVKGNTITAANGSSASQTHFAAGVELNGASSATVVQNNTITGPVSGIRTYGNGYDILDNTVTGRQIGINIVNSDNLLVTGNTSKATASLGYGISATEASDNSVISGNNVKGSSGPDCFEEMNTGGIDNDWSENQFNDASPAGLCTDGDVPG
jgi:nitrous oxidase accessory protein NosD